MTSQDRWHDGSGYEAYVGRWSREVARRFLPWLGVAAGARWVDVGCGTGVVSGTILDLADPASVVGIDPSAAFLEAARARLADPRIRFEEARADAIPLDDGSADAAIAGLVLNFVPDVPRALEEIRRVVARGGTIGGYVWDYAGEMQLMRRFWDAAVELDPAAAALDEGRRFPICHPAALEAAFVDAALANVSVMPIDVPTVFVDFDDYWAPFLSGVAPAPGYTVGLAPEARERLRRRLETTLPRAADGSIHLIARAWAVHGRV